VLAAGGKSVKGKIPLAEAQAIGDQLLGALVAWGYPRARVLGSVRRKKPEVGDIELLVEAKELEDPSVFRRNLEAMGLLEAEPDVKGRKAPNGPRYYKRILADYNGYPVKIQVDVFVCMPPAQWGVLELIRTGDAQFSHAMVTRLHKVGLKSENGVLQVTDPTKWSGSTVSCDDEAQFFAYVMLPFIEPERRDWSIAETRVLVEGP
jgi:DNA polymerase/3'-5' exonuclease PolX